MTEQFPDTTLAETLRTTGLPVILTTDADGAPCYVKLDKSGAVVRADVAEDRRGPNHEG